jgi:hypothetical protein
MPHEPWAGFAQGSPRGQLDRREPGEQLSLSVNDVIVHVRARRVGRYNHWSYSGWIYETGHIRL